MNKISKSIAGLIGLLLSSTFMIGPTFASTVNEFNSYTIAYNAQPIMHPLGFVHDETAYMPVQDVLDTLKQMDIHTGFASGNLVIGDPLPVDTHPNSSSKATIYANGRFYASVPAMNISDEKTNQVTTYIPIWYVMQALGQIGQKNTWNGHTWILGHLFA
jgi:mannosyl-glycoprotein endo-beta-N-acetylglucosaminidase